MNVLEHNSNTLASLDEKKANILLDFLDTYDLDEEYYDSPEAIDNGVLGGEIDLEWPDARDLDYADTMVRYQQLLVRALTIFAQGDKKSLHNANKAFETLVRDARRIKSSRMADIQKAQEVVSLMDEIIQICDTHRK